MRILRTTLAVLAATLAGWASAPAAETVSRPFAGVTYTARVEASPRPLKMHVVDIDLSAPGLRFHLTPHEGPLHTRKQTTLDYLRRQGAQIAINAHFFEPWPPPEPDPGTASLVGIAASDGQVYAPFLVKPPKAYAIHANAPGLNIDAANRASIVHRSPADPSGHAVAEAVKLHNTLAGNEQIVTGGLVTAADSDWNNRPGPRTAIGVTGNQHLVLFVVDGRQPGVSEGLTVPEVARLLAGQYGVVDALNLDGGGSATLAIADPTPRVANVPVGVGDAPGTQRAVGSNLAVFAMPIAPAAVSQSAAPPVAVPAGPSAGPWLLAGLGLCLAAGAILVAWRRRAARPR